jgi:bile acid:Na+ symporter, BASS family
VVSLLTVPLILLAKIAIVAMILAIGMGSTFSDVTYIWRRPNLLLRSLLAMYVVVPLVTLLIATIVPVVPAVKAALLVLAVSAGAPLLSRKLGGIGNSAYVFSLTLTSSLLAIIIVPAWVALLAWHFGVAAQVSPADVAAMIAKAFLLPLLVGMVSHLVAPALSERVAERLLPVGGIVLSLAGVAVLILHWDIVLEVHGPGLLALLLLILVAMAVGHYLGGPSPEDRTALAIACATRHVGIAVVVATMFRGPRTLVLIAAYVVTSALVSLPYLRWRRQSRHPWPPPGHLLPAAGQASSRLRGNRHSAG